MKVYLDEKIEEERISPVDNLSAISTQSMRHG
jgi:hypothetical protein